MKYRNDSPGSAGLELSPWEATQLLAFLEPRLHEAEPDAVSDTLEPIADKLVDKLDDATALARWLRENVILELPSTEAVHLLTVLETGVLADEEESHDRPAVLAGIRQKLHHALASISVMATR